MKLPSELTKAARESTALADYEKTIGVPVDAMMHEQLAAWLLEKGSPITKKTIRACIATDCFDDDATAWLEAMREVAISGDTLDYEIEWDESADGGVLYLPIIP